MKSEVKYCLLVIVLCLALGTALAEDKPIKLGVQFVMSGEQGDYGMYGKRGVGMALDEINSAGGILGRKVRAVFVDTELKPEKAVRDAERLIREENVDFLIGPTASKVAVPLSEAARKHKKILVVTQSLTDALTGSRFNPYLFSVLSNSIMLSRSGAYLMASKPYKRWMCVGPDYNFGRASWKMFKDKLKELRPDVEFVGEAWPKLLTRDYTPHINKILKLKPDAVWCPLWGSDALAFIRQSMPLGLFKKTKSAFPIGASMTVLEPLGKEMPEGIFMTACYFFTSPDSQMNREFVQAYYSKFKEYPDHMAAEAYAGAYFLKAAVERAGTTDSGKIVEAVDREPLAWEAPGGWKIMRKEDHQAVQGVIWGETAYSEKYGFAVLTNIRSIPAAQISRSRSELDKVVADYRTKQQTNK